MTKKTKAEIYEIIQQIHETRNPLDYSNINWAKVDELITWAKADSMRWILGSICNSKNDKTILEDAKRYFDLFKERVESYPGKVEKFQVKEAV